MDGEILTGKKMIQVSVSINYISAEKFWEHGRAPPPSVHISTNVNIVGVEQKGDALAVPFIVTIGYMPSVAQISLKGQAIGCHELLTKVSLLTNALTK